MSDTFQIQFQNAHIAHAVRFSRGEQLQQALDGLKIEIHPQLRSPVLVLVGGASGMTAEYLADLASFFTQVICPLMEEFKGIVIDGGTDAGIMSLMGVARHQTRSHFPLIGVAAQGTVRLPEQPTPAFEDYALLEPHHTHFVLAPGTLWGDESPWIAEVANLLTCAKSVTLLVNGGKISWQDVSNSIRVKRPVLVLAGSGRTADELAMAIAGDRSNERANQFVDSGLLNTVQLTPDLASLKATIAQYLF